jgi:hypothetical protein
MPRRNAAALGKRIRKRRKTKKQKKGVKQQ